MGWFKGIAISRECNRCASCIGHRFKATGREADCPARLAVASLACLFAGDGRGNPGLRTREEPRSMCRLNFWLYRCGACLMLPWSGWPSMQLVGLPNTKHTHTQAWKTDSSDIVAYHVNHQTTTYNGFQQVIRERNS